MKLFFILYDSRSGSTFLADKISTSFGIPVLPETNFIDTLIRKRSIFPLKSSKDIKHLVSVLFREKKFKDLNISYNEIYKRLSLNMRRDEVIYTILNIYREKEGIDSECIGIKKGNYIHLYKRLIEYFPNSKYIALIRDGRDIYLSKRSSVFDKESGKKFVQNVCEAIYEWRLYMNSLIQIQSNINRVLVIKYEDMTKDEDSLQTTLLKIKEWLNIKELNSGKGYYVSNIYDENLHKNIRGPLLTTNKEKWRNKMPLNQEQCYEAINGRLLLEYNYPLVKEWRYIDIFLFLIKNRLCLKCISYIFLKKPSLFLKR